MDEPQSETPVIRVVAGSPTPEELAAIVTVLTAAATPEESPPETRRSAGAWKSYARLLRTPLRPGPGAWRHTYR